MFDKVLMESHNLGFRAQINQQEEQTITKLKQERTVWGERVKYDALARQRERGSKGRYDDYQHPVVLRYIVNLEYFNLRCRYSAQKWNARFRKRIRCCYVSQNGYVAGAQANFHVML